MTFVDQLLTELGQSARLRMIVVYPVELTDKLRVSFKGASVVVPMTAACYGTLSALSEEELTLTPVVCLADGRNLLAMDAIVGTTFSTSFAGVRSLINNGEPTQVEIREPIYGDDLYDESVDVESLIYPADALYPSDDLHPIDG